MVEWKKGGNWNDKEVYDTRKKEKLAIVKDVLTGKSTYSWEPEIDNKTTPLA